eukprot:14995014-Alexandrium_andersonii.AAC.1
MSASLVGSEMCIRDRTPHRVSFRAPRLHLQVPLPARPCAALWVLPVACHACPCRLGVAPPGRDGCTASAAYPTSRVPSAP